MASAWIFQDPHQVKKHGPDKASFYVGWIDYDGRQRCKSFGPGDKGRDRANAHRAVIENQLAEGSYKTIARKTWAQFREEYEEKILPSKAARTQEEIRSALTTFERITRPVKMAAIKTKTIDDFVAKRRLEPGKKKGAATSNATINKLLRTLKAALHVAHEWEYVHEVPKFKTLRELEEIPLYVTPEHFTAIYQSCQHATRPTGASYSPADWWRALTVFCYMTGWRIGQVLALRREDVDLKSGQATSRAKDNKGKRDTSIPLPAVVADHLKMIQGFDSVVFPWNHNKTILYKDFAAIQEAAGIRLECHEQHEHTRFCRVYGFHDFRRAFATMNADKLTEDTLRNLMQHRSISTTKRYIAVARQLDAAVENLYVPEVLRKTAQA